MHVKILSDLNHCIFCKKSLVPSDTILPQKQICSECLKEIDITIKNDLGNQICLFAQDLKKFVVKIIHIIKTFDYKTIILFGDRNAFFASILIYYFNLNTITNYTLIDYSERLSTNNIESRKVIQIGISFIEHINMIDFKELLKKQQFKINSILLYEYGYDTITERFILLKNGIQWITSKSFNLWYLPIEFVLELSSTLIEYMDSFQNEYELYLGKIKNSMTNLKKN